MTQLNVLKLGGGAGVDHTASLANLAQRIKDGERWVLVHGASAEANALTEATGYEVKTITSPGGHTSRYTDATVIRYFRMAAAAVNQQMVAELEQNGISAVGLAGPNIIRAARKKAIRAVRNGRQMVIRDDFSGSIESVNGEVLTTLLDTGLTPVVAPLAMSHEFEPLNVDGDLVAATVANTLSADRLIILTNVPGLLKDVDDPASLVSKIPMGQMAQYEDYAQGRMKKKLMAAQRAGVGTFILADSRVETPLDAAVAGGGTHVTA